MKRLRERVFPVRREPTCLRHELIALIMTRERVTEVKAVRIFRGRKYTGKKYRTARRRSEASNSKNQSARLSGRLNGLRGLLDEMHPGAVLVRGLLY
jgi:hypothetical protein